MTEPHLLSAAAALERILADMHPEYEWIVSVGGRRGDWEGAARAPAPPEDPSAVADNA